jgi:lauroyl/myristoyl acyltransferase
LDPSRRFSLERSTSKVGVSAEASGAKADGASTVRADQSAKIAILIGSGISEVPFYMPGHAPRLLTASDVLEIIRIPVLMAVSWTFPERHWESFANVVVLLMARLRRKRSKMLRQQYERLFDDRIDAASLDSMANLHLVEQIMARMQGIREYRPRGWHPEINVTGKEHIEAARTQGHGVLLWVAPFVYCNLITKKGLHETGYRVSHLSHPFHGYSSSMLGFRILNPIWTRIEDRYLAERVRQSDGTGLGSAITILRRRLQKKRIVSITATRHVGKTVRAAFLNAELHLSTGPVRLARAANAVLLPVFITRTDTGLFMVNLGAPLCGPTSDNSEESPAAIIQRYVRMLEQYVLDYPSQWDGGVG